MFPQQTYSRIIALRATSAGSLGVAAMCALVAPSYNPPDFTAVVGGCAFLIWLVTAPWAIVPYLVSVKQNLRWPFARTRTTYTPWSVVRRARTMDAPIPSQVQVVTSDRLNAATDGITLSMTSAMERELLTSVGEGTIAHELAHAKLGHFNKKPFVVAAVAVVAVLLSAPSWAFHEAIGAIMGVAAFLTLLALVSRKNEYDADALACTVVGPRAMITTLESLAPREKWDLESDTHPSIRARVQRLLMT